MADNILCLIQLNKRAVDSLLSLCYTRRYPFSDCSYKRRKKTYMPIYFQEKTSWKLNERLIVIETFSIKSADTFSHLKWLWRLLLRIPCKQNLICGKLIKKRKIQADKTHSIISIALIWKTQPWHPRLSPTPLLLLNNPQPKQKRFIQCERNFY